MYQVANLSAHGAASTKLDQPQGKEVISSIKKAAGNINELNGVSDIYYKIRTLV